MISLPQGEYDGRLVLTLLRWMTNHESPAGKPAGRDVDNSVIAAE